MRCEITASRPVSSGVLATVKSMIYSDKRYTVFGNMCKKTDGDNLCFIILIDHLGLARSNTIVDQFIPDWEACWEGIQT